MRTSIIIILSLAMLAMFACQEKKDIAEEKETIIKINEKELQASKNHNIEVLASIWLHEPYIAHGMGKTDQEVRGWDSLRVAYKRMSEELKQIEYTAENYDITITGNVAFLMYDETMEAVLSGEGYSHEKKVYKYFIKKDGEWKLFAVL